MKLLLIIICLTLCKAMTAQNIYYGANVGVGISKSWDGKKKEIRQRINDLYLSVPIGFKSRFWVAEISPQVTASLITSISGMAGGKVDIGDNAGIHLLFGYKDEVLYSPRPLQLIHYFYPQFGLRFWIGNFQVQTTYTRKENSEIQFGIGCIGLWEKIN